MGNVEKRCIENQGGSMTDKEFEMELKKYGFERQSQEVEVYWRGNASVITTNTNSHITRYS